MTAIQPDIFGEYDRAQDYAARARQPHTCPACGKTEPNGFLLRTNHAIDFETGSISSNPPGNHPIYGAMCVAQFSVRNHLIYALRNGKDTTRAIEKVTQYGLNATQIIEEERTTH